MRNKGEVGLGKDWKRHSVTMVKKISKYFRKIEFVGSRSITGKAVSNLEGQEGGSGGVRIDWAIPVDEEARADDLWIWRKQEPRADGFIADIGTDDGRQLCSRQKL